MKVLKEIKRKRVMLKITSRLWIKVSLFADFKVMRDIKNKKRIAKFNKNVYNWNKYKIINKKLITSKMFDFYNNYSKNNKL